MYTPLHVYTGSTYLKSGLKVENYVNALAKAGFKSLAISDFETLRGAPKFVHLCDKANVKPIIGVDIVLEDLLFSLYVKNENGYRNLLSLLFNYRQGKLSLDNLNKFTNDLVVIISILSKPFKDNFADNKNFPRWLVNIQRGIEDFYLGLDMTDSDLLYLRSVREFAAKYTYNTVAFPFIRYLKPDGATSLKMCEAIEKGVKIERTVVEGSQYVKKEEELLEFFTIEEVNETNVIADKINFNLISKRGEMIKYQNDLGLSSDDYLRHLVTESLKAKGLDNNPIYVERANYELDTIIKMGYSDYFLLVQDYVNWAKNNDILVGPGRGSGAGSLVAYCLNITIADPLKFNLIFERFLNIERQTMPDIDVDFSNTKRSLVLNYLKTKFGHNHVANILAINNMKARQALQDTGKVFDFDESVIKALSKLIDPKLSLKENYTTNAKFNAYVNSDVYFKQIINSASRIEGLPRQSSVGAAGIILNAEPLENVLPVTFDAGNNYIGEYEKDYIEEQNFLKMDILSLETLAIIENCLDRIKASTGKVINYYDIPYDDEKALNLIKYGKTMGLFQIETVNMRSAIKQLRPSSFDDVVALLSLNRPGPDKYISLYAKRKEGKEKYSFASPVLKEILGPTYGIIIYQEQIMQIANKMAGLSLAQADVLRSAISKKKEEKMQSMKNDFISGCIKNGYSEQIANSTWDDIYSFAGYGFNKSHAVVYAIVSCQMAYLKYYYPSEFYASILEYADAENLSSIISEIKSRKITIACPSVNNSIDNYCIVNNKLLFPLSAIKNFPRNLADNIVKEINENGPFSDFFDFVIRTAKYRIDATEIIRLINAGALDCLGENRTTMRLNVPKAIGYSNMVNDGQGHTVIDISLLPKPVVTKVEDDLFINLKLEYDVLGYMISGSPLSLYKDKAQNIRATNIVDLEQQYGKITLVCVIKNIKTITNKKGEQMAFLTVYDDTGETEFAIFSEVYLTSITYLKVQKVIVVDGYYNPTKDKNNLSIDSIKLLEDY